MHLAVLNNHYLEVRLLLEYKADPLLNNKAGVNAKDYAKLMTNLSLIENPFILIDRLCANDNCGYGTEIVPAFELLNREVHSDTYQRVFIISDMQVMDDNSYWYYRGSAIKNYHKYFGMTPCYSFDLGNYHTQLVSRYDNIHYTTALNDQVFKFIGLLESGINLVDYINTFNYY